MYSIRFPCHSSPFGTMCREFTSQKEAFPIALKTPTLQNGNAFSKRIPIIPGHPWFSGHGHIFAAFAQLLQLLCHFRQQHVKFSVPCRQTQFRAWNMCANDLVTFSRPKDIALYQLDLQFFWILLVCQPLEFPDIAAVKFCSHSPALHSFPEDMASELRHILRPTPISYMGHGGFLKWGYPQIINFNMIFHYKPSILRYPHLWKPPHGFIDLRCRNLVAACPTDHLNLSKSF